MKRWVRRYGPQAFVMHGFDGVLIAPHASEPVLSLMIAQSEPAHKAAQEIIRRHSNSNATARAFWNEVMNSNFITPKMFIGGEIVTAPDPASQKRIYDLFLMFAMADARPDVARAVALEMR